MHGEPPFEERWFPAPFHQTFVMLAGTVGASLSQPYPRFNLRFRSTYFRLGVRGHPPTATAASHAAWLAAEER